jgi:hypothetical protein
VGTAVAVQQKLMRHADIQTTMNIYGDVVTDEMFAACGKVAHLALDGRENGREAELKPLFWRKRVRVERLRPTQNLQLTENRNARTARNSHKRGLLTQL